MEDLEKETEFKKDRQSKICIQGMLEDKFDEKDIRQFFKGYGTIESIEIPRDHITMKAKGYILIDFSSGEEAKDAVNYLNGYEIDGKKISV
jgi:RNA recognition motif-containing protein